MVPHLYKYLEFIYSMRSTIETNKVIGLYSLNVDFRIGRLIIHNIFLRIIQLRRRRNNNDIVLVKYLLNKKTESFVGKMKGHLGWVPGV